MCCLSVLQVPTSCPGVPAVLLQPALQWADKADFNDTLSQLAALFVKNFKVRERGPCCLSSSNAGGGQGSLLSVSARSSTQRSAVTSCNSGKARLPSCRLTCGPDAPFPAFFCPVLSCCCLLSCCSPTWRMQPSTLVLTWPTAS